MRESVWFTEKVPIQLLGLELSDGVVSVRKCNSNSYSVLQTFALAFGTLLTVLVRTEGVAQNLVKWSENLVIPAVAVFSARLQEPTQCMRGLSILSNYALGLYQGKNCSPADRVSAFLDETHYGVMFSSLLTVFIRYMQPKPASMSPPSPTASLSLSLEISPQAHSKISLHYILLLQCHLIHTRINGFCNGSNHDETVLAF